MEIEGKNDKHTFFWTSFPKMDKSSKSVNFFQLLARGLQPNNGVNNRGKTTGTTIGKHNGGKQNRKQQRKVNTKMYVFFCIFYLLNCF